MRLREALTAAAILPVLVIDDAAIAHSLAEILRDGGFPLVEITLRTPAALDSIRAMAEVEGVLVGAGTVTTPGQVNAAVVAGAGFIVSPGLSPAVISRARELDTPAVPGVVTPTEIMTAVDLGVDLLKFFPAEASGGIRALAALGAPFPQVRFIPTGGITTETAGAYLALPNVAAVGGSWIATRDLLNPPGLAEIRRRTAAAQALVGTAGGPDLAKTPEQSATSQCHREREELDDV